MPEEHAILSPSDSKNWPLCPGKVNWETAHPEDQKERPNDDSLLGTRVHFQLARCLNDGMSPYQLDTAMDHWGTYDITSDMQNNIQLVIGYILQRQKEMIQTHGEMRMLVERKVDAGPYLKLPMDLCWGTADITLLWEKFLEVIDYKNGRHYVDHKLNSQILIYLAGAISASTMPTQGLKIPIEGCRGTIIQPNSNGEAIRFMEYAL